MANNEAFKYAVTEVEKTKKPCLLNFKKVAKVAATGVLVFAIATGAHFLWGCQKQTKEDSQPEPATVTPTEVAPTEKAAQEIIYRTIVVHDDSSKTTPTEPPTQKPTTETPTEAPTQNPTEPTPSIEPQPPASELPTSNPDPIGNIEEQTPPSSDEEDSITPIKVETPASGNGNVQNQGSPLAYMDDPTPQE